MLLGCEADKDAAGMQENEGKQNDDSFSMPL
jgi:hypothetical protein